MSASAATLTNEEYEERKVFLEELKRLVISEQEEIFRILKRGACEYSENTNGVFFDVKRHLLFYKGKEYNVDYDWYRHNDYSMLLEKYLKPIAHRVYYDYCVNGFMMNDDIFSYGTNIHERPEFMMKLTGAFPDLKKMEDEWAKRSKSYKVNFYATIDQIHRLNFDLNETQEELTDEEIEKIKRWMVSHAFDRANSNLLSEVFLYVKDEIDIPPEQITSCEEI